MLVIGFSKGGVGEYCLVKMDLYHMVMLLVIHHARCSPSVQLLRALCHVMPQLALNQASSA